MKRLQPTTKYKKDLKRYANNPKKIAALTEVLKLLKNEQPIPAEYQPHMLHGNYQDCMECHIQGDFLLIWIDPEPTSLSPTRMTGSLFQTEL